MRLPPSVKNWVSLMGATIALISFFMIVFLFAITTFFEQQSAYLGLVVYILLPGILLMGLFLIPVGMALEIRRERQGRKRPTPEWPRIDLNIPHHRNAALIFAVGTAILLFVSAIGSYEAFHYTESTEFCGLLCHAVMEPEHTAHGNSPHARVACVKCHVGPGADWYVRSKLSGLYQVYAVLTNSYPRPIPTPIENLRPPQAICEQCHWPQKFYSYQYLVETHFLPEPDNPRWDIGMTLKIGPPREAIGFREGIHWHINPQVRIDYVASDEKRLQIPWVRSVNRETGETKIFRTEETKWEEPPPGEEVRVMDCIDCHNRPSHRYQSPSEFVNAALARGEIPPDLPGIKALAVELCQPMYESKEAAFLAIEEGIESYYKENYPEALKEKGGKIAQAVAGLREAFALNIFPYMNARWSVYPDHSSHLESPGCFRCHDGKHRAPDGDVISLECDLCHDINSQGPPREMKESPVGRSLEFQHPTDIGEAWKEMLCPDCHAAGEI